VCSDAHVAHAASAICRAAFQRPFGISSMHIAIVDATIYGQFVAVAKKM
jgi:hypothetical protein